MDAGAIAVLIPIVAVGGFFTWMISLSPLGKAFAERLRHGPVPPPQQGSAEREELAATVDALRQEVAELVERVDFTERLLTKAREGGLLSPPNRVSG
jgi:hypothetical protein